MATMCLPVTHAPRRRIDDASQNIRSPGMYSMASCSPSTRSSGFQFLLSGSLCRRGVFRGIIIRRDCGRRDFDFHFPQQLARARVLDAFPVRRLRTTDEIFLCVFGIAAIFEENPYKVGQHGCLNCARRQSKDLVHTRDVEPGISARFLSTCGLQLLGKLFVPRPLVMYWAFWGGILRISSRELVAFALLAQRVGHNRRVETPSRILTWPVVHSGSSL